MPAACAIEMIHTYSLIHDDLPAMDNDSLRRGRPTLHVVYGEGLAILAGDGLLAEAFALLAREPAPPGPVLGREEAARQSSSSPSAAGVAGMAGGQAIDLDAAGTSRAGAAGDVAGRRGPAPDARPQDRRAPSGRRGGRGDHGRGR